MGNIEGIKKYHEDGWNFRIKTVKEKHYITRRKGQKEKSLGPYNEEKWKKILQIQNKTNKLIHHSRKPTSITPSQGTWEDKRIEWDHRLSQLKAAEMMMTCLHKEIAGYCTYFTWRKKPRFFQIGDELGIKEKDYSLKKIEKNESNEYRWLHKACIPFCKNCSAYLSKKTIDKIQKVFREV